MSTKMERLFSQDPPKRPIVDLDSLVDDWVERFGADGASKHMRDEVVEYCMTADSIEAVVDRACASLRPSGKVHNHQSRVKAKDRQHFAFLIKIKWDMVTINNFDELHDWLEEVAPPGIGPVTVYDVATRIAAYLKMEPTSLYLHAGVRIGWHRLHGSRHYPEVKGRVPRHMLPAALQRIPTDEVEDMICAYKEYLGPWLK
jgi:hypothetical protein